MTALPQILNGSSGKDARDTMNTVVPLLRRNPNLGGIISDSRGENFTTAVAPATRLLYKSLQNPIVWYQALSGQRLRIVYNGGISGNRSDQYLSALSPHTDTYPNMNNLDALIASPALWAIFCGIAVNDFSQAKLADDIWPALKAAFDKCIVNGMRLILFAEAGAAGLNAAAVAQVHRLNALLRAYCYARAEAILIDVPSVAWLPAATSTTAISQRVGYYGDGTHFLVRGAYAVAKEMDRVIGGRIPPLAKLPVSPTEIPGNGGVQIYDKPLLVPAATTYSTPSWVTFNSALPAGITFSRQLNGTNNTGAATLVADMVTTADGYQGLRLAATFSQANEAILIDVSLDQTLLTAGDLYFGVGQIDVAAGATASVGMYRIGFTPNGAAQVVSYDLYNDWSPNFGAFPADAMTLTAETGLLAVPAFPTGMTSSTLRFKLATSGAAGSITAVLSRIAARKVLSI